MNIKEFKVTYKDEGSGSIEGYASTWIKEPDSYGDIVKQGAFKNSLKERWSGGQGIPFIWAHQMDNLKSYIGKAEAKEDEKGLFFHAEFDDTEEAQRVRQMYKDGRLKKFSFAYDTLDSATVELEDGRKANELRELDIYEISAVLVPANDDAGVVDVKSGKRNSKADEERLKELNGYIDNAFGALQAAQNIAKELIGDQTEEDDGKANTEVEEPESVNFELQKGLLDSINKLIGGKTNEH